VRDVGGCEARWADVLGQNSGAVASVSDKSEADRKNREIFEERVDMLLKCWTEESVVLDSPSYQAPFPLSGVEGYPAWRTALAAGAIGETAQLGRTARLCALPQPHPQPQPPRMGPATPTRGPTQLSPRAPLTPA